MPLDDAPKPPPGWYPDRNDPRVVRWWTGRNWSTYTKAAEQSPPAASSPLAPTAQAAAPTQPIAAGRSAAPTLPITTQAAVPAQRARRRLSAKEGVALIGFALLLLMGLTAGIGGVLVMLGLGGLVVGLYAVITGRSRVFRLRSRLMGFAALGVAFVLFGVGSAAYGAQHPTPTSQEANTAAAKPSAKPSPAVRKSAAPGPIATAAVVTQGPGTALAVLATLPVKGRAPMTGYARVTDFGTAWFDVDRNGCDTRNDVLRRDLTGTTGTGCRVLTGVLNDPYTGSTIDFVRGEGTSTAVQIDHIVSLGDAWQTGAQGLSQAKRIDLANDPINLFAVDGPTNEAKGDGDTATWLPPSKAFRCTYVAHQVGVKAAYGLWVTPAEKAAMQRVLATCPTAMAPTSETAALTPVIAPPKPKPKPTATATAKPNPKPVASTPSLYYANCDAVRAAGKAPLDRGEPGYRSGLDRDGDGVACESSSSSGSSGSSSGSGGSSSDAPAGATAECNDGTYSWSQHHSGTCSHHGGVSEWL